MTIVNGLAMTPTNLKPVKRPLLERYTADKRYLELWKSIAVLFV